MITLLNRYGLFHSICKGYEMVMADESVLWCDPNQNSDLYYAIPWSFGTFGFLTAVEMDIIPCKPYVRLHFQPTTSFKDVTHQLQAAYADKSNDIIEGILFDKTSGVVISGKFVDKVKVNKSYDLNNVIPISFMFAHIRHMRSSLVDLIVRHCDRHLRRTNTD